MILELEHARGWKHGEFYTLNPAAQAQLFAWWRVRHEEAS